MAKGLRSAFIGVAIVAALSLLAHLLFQHYVNRPPFVVIMRPAADGGATVQFIQPHDLVGRTSASPEFYVDVKLERPFVESLDSRRVTIPGAVVEHGDTTVLPGAFHLRFGKEVMYVMSSRVSWKGVEYEWQAADASVSEDEAGRTER